MTKKERWIKFLNEFEVYLGAIIFAAITILLTVQVISRYVLGHAFTWAEELSTIGFIWMAYLGTSGAVLKGKHLRIDLFLNMMHGTVKKIVLIFTNVVTMFFCCYISIPLLQLVGRYHNSGAVTTLTGLPKYLVYAMLPFCLLLTTVRLIQDTVRVSKSDPDDVKISTATTLFANDDDEKKDGEGEDS